LPGWARANVIYFTIGEKLRRTRESHQKADFHRAFLVGISDSIRIAGPSHHLMLPEITAMIETVGLQIGAGGLDFGKGGLGPNIRRDVVAESAIS
jgi:hypothetical protein